MASGDHRVVRRIGNLYRAVNNGENPDVIRWSENGDSFIISNREGAARLIGHRTWDSTRAMLRNFNFHMVNHPLEFRHPNFQKDRENMLCLVRSGEWPNAIIPEDPSPLPASPQSTPEQIPSSSRSGQMLDVDSLLDGISAIRRHQEVISSELSEFRKLNERLWKEAEKRQDTIDRILKLLAGVFGSAAASLVHRSDDGGPQIDAHVLRKRQRLVIADGHSGNTHDTFAHTTSPTPLASEFTPTDDHTESALLPPGPCVSTPTPNQTALPSRNTSHPTKSAPIPHFNPALPLNANAASASSAPQSDAVQNAINHMMGSPQFMRRSVQVLQNSGFPIQPPSSSVQPITTGHPNNQSTTHSPAQLCFGFGHQGLTPKVANLNIEPMDPDSPVPVAITRLNGEESQEDKGSETAS